MKMTLELSLVQTQNMYGNFYEILNRKRVFIENGDEDAVPEIIKFLIENIDYVDAYINDKAIVANIREIQALTTTELACLRYMLGTFGLDVLAYIVAETEDNPEGLATGLVEYNIIDTNDYMTASIPFVSKIVMDADKASLPALYKAIDENFELFKGDLFADFGNQIVQYSNILDTSAQLTGIVMPAVTNQINSILNFLGIKIIVITNSDPVEV